jgi:TP901 family phage tail tape measure protein
MILQEILTKFGLVTDKAELAQWQKGVDKAIKSVVKLNKVYKEFQQRTKRKLGKGLQGLGGLGGPSVPGGKGPSTPRGPIPGLKPMQEGIDKANEGLGKLDKKYKVFRKRVNKKIGTGLKGFANKLDRFSRGAEFKFRRILKPMRQMGRHIPILGTLLSGLTPAGIAAMAAIWGVVKAVQALTSAVRKYLDFEKGMKNVQRVVLGTAKDMERLSKASLKAGEASIFTAAQAAEAAQFLSQAGLSVEQTIAALPGTLQLAAAANMDLAQSAKAATDIMSSQGLKIKDLTRVNDMLVASAKNATQDVAGFAAGFATVGNEAALAALDIETVGAALGILAKQGQKDQLGGTLFRNLLAESKRKKFKKALKDVGIDLKDFMNLGTGEFKDFTGFIQKLATLNKQDLFAFTQKGFAQASRGKRALLSLVNLSDLFVANLGKIRDSSGIAEKAAAVAFTGLSGQIALLKSKMEIAAISFVKDSGLGAIAEDLVAVLVQILPPLIKGLGAVLSPIGAMISAITSLVRLIATIGGGALKPIVNVASGLLSLIGKLLSPFGTIMGKILSGFETIFTVMSDLEDGPMSGLMSQLDKWADGWSAWAHNILREINPFLEMLDLVINAFLFDFPLAAKAFNKELSKLAEDSFFFKAMKFIIGDVSTPTKEGAKETGTGGVQNPFTRTIADAAVIIGATGKTLEKAGDFITAGFTQFGEFITKNPMLLTPGAGGFGPPPVAGESSSSSSRVVTVGDINTTVVLPEGANVEDPESFLDQIGDAISTQMRDLFREGE